MAESSDPPGSHFYIHVLQATLDTPLDSTRKLHVAVNLPSAKVVRTEPLENKRGDVKLEWNRRVEFTTIPSQEIKLELVIERFRGRKVHGEARIVIEDLLQRCHGPQDCTLELRGGASGEAKGNITVRLERKSSEGLTHQLIGEELSQLEQDSRLTELLRVGETNDEGAVETIGLLLARMKPLLPVLDAVSIIPAFENARGSVAALYKVYQKRTIVDAEIKELLRIMRSALKLVQNTSSSKDVLSHSEDTVGKLLGTIHESSQFIHEYLDITGIGQMWKTEINIKRLEECKKRLESHRSDLHGDAIGTMMRTYKGAENKELHVVIPPRPTELFIGRDNYLDQMNRSFDLTKTSMELKKQRRFILFGIGGAGKTQLGLKFVEQNGDEFTKRYMIDASSAESIALSFEAIGATLGVENPDVSKVLTLLSQLKEDWLLVYDNADDRKLHLASFFPVGTHGNIIVTTRNPELSGLAPNNNIEVLMLDEPAAISLLLQSSRLEDTEENRDLAQILVKKFGCLALAIVQAGSYIASRGLDLVKYSKIYDKRRNALLRTDLGQDVDYKAPVFTTWEISFAELNGHAQTLLNLCAFLYRDGITEDVFHLAVTSEHAFERAEEHEGDGSDVSSQKQYKGFKVRDVDLLPSSSFVDLIDWLRDEAGEWDDFHFAELMHNLCYYSLVQNPFPDIYSIHPLVHEWTRDRLGPSDRDAVQQDAWLLLYLSTRHNGDSASISVSRALVPHLSSCGHPTNIKIMETFVDVHWTCGRWDNAETLQVSVVEWRTRTDGNNHPNTLRSMENLAMVYLCQGHWTKAEELQVEVLEATKQKLGSDHPDTLSSMANLASTYWKQGHWTKAEEVQVEVLEMSKQKLGSDHPDTLSSMANLASTYWNQGHWTKAEELQVQVLETRKQKLGSGHPDTLTSMANLASTYWNQGHWNKAEELQVEVLETSKQKLGSDHPDTLTSMANLAATHSSQGHWTKAQELEVEVLETRKQKLGSDHPDTLLSMVNLALTYWNQGHWNKAEELQVEVLEISKQKMGSDHPDTLTSMANLGLTYWNQGHWTKAEELQVEVLEIRKQKQGSDHPDTLTSMADLASTYWNQGHWNKAEELQVEVLEIRKQKLGSDHPDTLRSMANLASTYWNQGHWTRAEELQVEVLEISKQKLGSDHPDTLTSMANLASTYRGQRHFTKAEELEVEVLDTRKQKLGPKHPDTLLSMNNLAITLHSQGHSNKAVTLLYQAVESSIHIYGPQHPTTLLFSKNLHSINHALGLLDKADTHESSPPLTEPPESSDLALHADLHTEPQKNT